MKAEMTVEERDKQLAELDMMTEHISTVMTKLIADSDYQVNFAISIAFSGGLGTGCTNLAPSDYEGFMRFCTEQVSRAMNRLAEGN